MNPLVSIVENKCKVIGYLAVNEVLDRIQNGSYKKEIEQIRKYHREGKGDLANGHKLKLVSFIVTGVFNGRVTKTKLSKFSNLIILDVDHLESNKLEQVLAIACSIPYTLACFLSPRGEGLKIIVAVSANDDYFKNSFEQVGYTD